MKDLALNVVEEEINRVEVIDEEGRSYTKYLRENQSVNLVVQDDGRTLKIFIEGGR